MITPKFNLQQTEDHVIVEINVPSARLEDADVEFSHNLFIFSCKPYYLRLHLTHDVRSIEQEKDITNIISCDIDKCKFFDFSNHPIPSLFFQHCFKFK